MINNGKMRILLFSCIAYIFFFPVPLKAEEVVLLNKLDISTGVLEQDNETGAIAKPRYNYFGESLLLFIPIKDEHVKDNNEIERNIYPFGIGGNLLFMTYILNRFFSPDRVLPGIMLGFTGSFYMMVPKPDYRDRFGELTILTIGIFTGYQFLFPVSKRVSISPALFTGGRYYISFHFFDDEVSTAYSPILIGGIDFSIIFDSFFSLSLRGEYQVYIEGEVKQTINISLGSGIFF